MEKQKEQHNIRWYAMYAGERIPRNSHMRARDWGWDAECSCGMETRTGGAIAKRITEAIADHKAGWDQGWMEKRK